MVDERWSWPGMCGARFAESRKICLVFLLFVMHGVLVECFGPAGFCLRFCFGIVVSERSQLCLHGDLLARAIYRRL